MIPIDLIAFALIALFLLFRLYQILGSRNGSERPPEQSGWHHHITRDPKAPSQRADAMDERAEQVIDITPQAYAASGGPTSAPVTESALSGIAKIKAADSTFAEGHFLRGARAAFELIVKAYSQEDKKTLRELCDPAVYGVYEKFITERSARGENMDTTLVRVRDPEIAAAELLGNEIRIEVAFASEQINVTRDADGKVVDGDPDRIFDVAEIWTFRRTIGSGSRWFLAATRTSA
jgi:predicted lipid-binding transport protein (Tim44 family)